MDPDLMATICEDDRGNLYPCADGAYDELMHGGPYEIDTSDTDPEMEYHDDRPCAQPGWEMDWAAMQACHDRCTRETTGFDNVLCNDTCEWEFCYEK